MLSTITHVFDLLSIRWPYVLAMVVAFAFVVSKGLSFFREAWNIFLLKWNLKRLDLNKLRVELASAAEHDLKEKSRFRENDELASEHPVSRNRWLGRIGIANICVGFLLFILWLFRR